MPTIIGRAARRLPGDCGDERVYGDDGTLTIRAGAPIQGAEPAEHRPTLLGVDGVSWRLDRHTREGARHVYALTPWSPVPVDREGLVVAYDPDRVHHARVEQLSLVLRAALLRVLLPVSPLAGLLPQDARSRLRERGLLPPATPATSLLCEWELMYLLAAGELLCALGGSPWLGAAFGIAALLVIVDILHRVTLLAESRDVGMLSWPRDLYRAVRQSSPAGFEASSTPQDKTPLP
ncbi:MAG: hypothetical protein FJ137_11025 [Deltaproteobacteria bacterium]|nr:hypothetical protein [Deltaproteobacteria bacterium]